MIKKNIFRSNSEEFNPPSHNKPQQRSNSEELNRMNFCQTHKKFFTMVCENCKSFMCCICHDDFHSKLIHKCFQFRSVLLQEFKFLRLIGKGGGGFVFEVTSQQIKTNRALKIIEFQANVDEEEKEEQYNRALKEINFLANIESPNIVKFYRNMFIKEENRFYILMELGEKSLTDVIEDLPPEKVEKYFKEICLGLQKIHQKHVAHRDLKPDNILICKDVAKLCDFGIISKVEGTLTITSMVGTVSYMAPEILKNEKFNVKCDIWALGLIYLQLITKNKKSLFHCKKKVETIQNIWEMKVILPNNLTPKQNQIIQGI